MAAAPDTVERVRSYYRTILPFYERESAGRHDLAFWAGLCRAWRPGSALELGCGLGRVTAVLRARSFRVGLDVSIEMLARAGRHPSVRRAPWFVAADARRFEFRPRFDLIVAPGDPISHWTRLRDRRAVLRRVARHLSPHGRFVLEGLYRRERRSFDIPARRVGGQTPLWVRESWRPAGPGSGWIARYLYRMGRGKTAREVSASFEARSWRPGEIRPFFRLCGLRVDALWGDFDRSPFTTSSPRLLVVARRARPPAANLRR